MRRILVRTGQVLTPYNWTYPYSEADWERNQLQCIHLHGYAPILKPEEHNIVFSIIEYLQATVRPYAWHRVFGDEFLQRPFIIVGARLTDEYDLAECLRRGSKSWEMNRRPSIIVLREISNIQKELFRRWGLVPVEAEAESFLSYLVKELPREEARIAKAIPGPPTKVLPGEARIFLQQFQWYRADAPLAVPREHDLYQGDEPAWADIINSLDARFEIVDKLLSDTPAERTHGSGKAQQIVHCLWGPAGSGKSAVLLRIGRELISRGLDVFNFRAEERLDIKAVFWWLQRSPNCALLFDVLADFSEDVGRLAQDCSAANVGLLIFAAERERRLPQVFAAIDPDFLKVGDDHRVGMLSDTDIDSLLAKLREQRRLGKLTRWTNDEQKRYFRQWARRQLFAGMAGLEGGRGFGARIKHEYLHDIQSEEARAVYAVASMSYALGYPLPLGIASVVAGTPSENLIKEATAGQLAKILQLESKGFKPRHRIVASLVVETALSRNDRFRFSQALVKALAPYITIDTIRQRTLGYLIVRRLMDQEVVFDWVGKDLVREWYDRLVPEYEWDARFWEQRALAEARLHSFSKARSFAEEALRIQRHPFTLNTLGTVLMRMATEHFEPGSEESRNVLWEGIGYIRESRDQREWRHEYPYNSFFTWALRYAEAAYKAQPVEPRLSTEWQRWMRDAEHAPVFAHRQEYERLQDFHRRWLSLAES